MTPLPKKLTTLRKVQDFAAIFRAREMIAVAGSIKTLGPEKWQASIEVGETLYRVDVTRYARRECLWSWEISSAGVHVRGGDERTLAEVETWLSETLGDLLPRSV